MYICVMTACHAHFAIFSFCLLQLRFRDKGWWADKELEEFVLNLFDGSYFTAKTKWFPQQEDGAFKFLPQKKLFLRSWAACIILHDDAARISRSDRKGESLSFSNYPPSRSLYCLPWCKEVDWTINFRKEYYRISLSQMLFLSTYQGGINDFAKSVLKVKVIRCWTNIEILQFD